MIKLKKFNKYLLNGFKVYKALKVKLEFSVKSGNDVKVSLKSIKFRFLIKKTSVHFNSNSSTRSAIYYYGKVFWADFWQGNLYHKNIKFLILILLSNALKGEHQT